MAGDSWTWQDMPDQSERTVVVTGANSGLGFEASKAFAKKGADVVLACRCTDRARNARQEIEDSGVSGSVVEETLDLADLESIHSFVETMESGYGAIDILCNNAGLMAIPRQETVDGFEMQFGVNHLGHFALTGLLVPSLMEASGDTRVVTHSSGLHALGKMNFEELQNESSYNRWRAYAQSKLANLLFAYELDRRLRAENIDMMSVGCNPGYVDTNLQRRGPEMSGSRWQLWVMQFLNKVFAQSPAKGVRPLLYAATSPDVTGGDYISPRRVLLFYGGPQKERSSPRSYDENAARRLWAISEELTGVSFGLSTA